MSKSGPEKYGLVGKCMEKCIRDLGEHQIVCASRIVD